MKPSSGFAVALAFAGLSLFACATGVVTEGGSTAGAGAAGGADGTSSSSSSTSTSTSTSTSSSSSGTTGPCVKQADCAAVADACNVGNCVNGTCQKAPANDGSQCDDGLYCTDNDACQSGTCVGGTQKFCPSPDSCHVGACDEATKACGSAPGNDGASCDDGDPCTYSGTCSAGACGKGSPVDCSAFNGTCSDGVCDPVLGCQSKPKNDGASCDDGLYCTVNDTCKAGACSGAPNTCAPPGDVCLIGTCDEASKSCVAVPGNNGSACSDGNPCHVNGTCSNGTCAGGVAGNQGAACDDGNGCTVGTTCSNGTCGNAAMTINQCLDNDKCCPPGCALGMDNDCSLTRWTDGTAQWPDDACNSVNSFGTCDTNAQNHADAWASFICQLNGYSKGIWTGLKKMGCSGGVADGAPSVSFYCQNMIPCAPLYEQTCQNGDQTQIQFTCFK